MPKLFLLGDSTCAIKEECARPETGWGECFSKYLNPSFELCNMAKNGRSTEMIIHEGIFFDCFEACSSGDYVIIQFGHNETKKEIYRRTYSNTTYKLNLKWFIDNLKKKHHIDTEYEYNQENIHFINKIILDFIKNSPFTNFFNIESLVKTILPEFLTYLDKLEKGEIVEKELDINKNPSNCDVNELKGVENAISFRNR